MEEQRGVSLGCANHWERGGKETRFVGVIAMLGSEERLAGNGFVTWEEWRPAVCLLG